MCIQALLCGVVYRQYVLYHAWNPLYETALNPQKLRNTGPFLAVEEVQVNGDPILSIQGHGNRVIYPEKGFQTVLLRI